MYSLAQLTQGLNVQIQGDPEYIIHGVAAIEDAKEHHITFLMNPLYRKYLENTKAGAVILGPEDAKSCTINAIICRNPYYIYAKIASFFEDKPFPPKGIHSTTVVGEGCHIDREARIGAHCVIGNHVTIAANVVLNPGCIIGDHVTVDEESYFHARVTLYSKVKIGKRVVLASGVVIGSDGFGIAKEAGAWHKVPQLGGVVI